MSTAPPAIQSPARPCSAHDLGLLDPVGFSASLNTMLFSSPSAELKTLYFPFAFMVIFTFPLYVAYRRFFLFSLSPISRVLLPLHPDLCKSACLQLVPTGLISRLLKKKKRAHSLFRNKVPHMKHLSKNMLISHLAVISQQLSQTNTVSYLANKGLNRLPSYHV